MLILIIVLFSSSILLIQTGLKFTYVNGSSMVPTYAEECSIVYGQETETIAEGDIIVYESEHFDDTVIHRVVKKYDNYNPNKSDHILLKDGQNKSQFIERGERIHETNQHISDIDTLQNETIYIAKGDNNKLIDPELIQKEQIQFVANNDDYILPTDAFCK